MKKPSKILLTCFAASLLLTACNKPEKQEDSQTDLTEKANPTEVVSAAEVVSPSTTETAKVEAPLICAKELQSDPAEDNLTIEAAYEALRQSKLFEGQIIYPLIEGKSLFYMFEDLIRINSEDAYLFAYGNETSEKRTIEGRYAVGVYGMIYQYNTAEDLYIQAASYDINTGEITFIEHGASFQNEMVH